MQVLSECMGIGKWHHNSLVRVFMVYLFDPLHATGLSLSPLKTSEDFWFFDI